MMTLTRPSNNLVRVAAGIAAVLFVTASVSADIPVMTFDGSDAEAFTGTFAAFRATDVAGELAVRDFRFTGRSVAWLGTVRSGVSFSDTTLPPFDSSFDEPMGLMAGVADFSVSDPGLSSESSAGGPVIASVIPAPGAVVLGVFGLGAIGCWIKRRSS
jgi:hypothetical protein